MRHDGAVAGRRATDAERDACVARLTDAYVSGALPLGDLHERTDRALAAQHVGELAVLVQDLDDPVTVVPPLPVRRPDGRRRRRRRRRLVTFGVSGLVVVAVAAGLGVTATQPPEPEALTSPDVCVSTGLRPDADGPLGGRCPVPSRAQVAILEAEAQARTSFQYARGSTGGDRADELVAQARDGRDRAVAAATTSRQAVAVDRATPALLRRLEREAEQAGEQARRAALDLAALSRGRDAPRR